MILLKRITPLVLAALLSACIELPEVESPPDGGPAAGFTLTVSPSQMAIAQGGVHSFQLSASRKGGFAGDISVGLLSPPTGITAQPVTLTADAANVDLVISVGESAEPGIRTLVLRGTAGQLSADAQIEVTVLRAGDLLVRWENPASNTVYVNGTVLLTVSVEGGTADSLEFLNGEATLAQQPAPPYQLNWDTTHEAEGTYQIVARARRGSSTFESSLLTVVVDRTPPSVVSRTPLPGAPFVSVKESITAAFSESLKPSSVTDSSIVVSTNASGIAKTLSLTPDGKVLTVSPSAPLPIQSTVTVSLGTSLEPLTDLAGNPLLLTEPWTFEVPAWLPMGGPISAVSGTTAAQNVVLRIASNGKPLIAWSEFDGSSDNVHVHIWNGSAWQALGWPHSALPEANTSARNVDFILDALDHPVLVWDEATGSDADTSITNLYARRWTGDDWIDLPSFPALSLDTKRYDPTVMLDINGNPRVVATYYDGATYGLYGFKLGSTNTWLTDDPYYPRHTHMNAGRAVSAFASGNFLIAYDAFIDAQPFTRGIVVIRNNFQLGSPLVPSTDALSALNPSIAIDGAGNPFVAWQEVPSTDTSQGTIYAAHWSGTWQRIGGVVSSGSTFNEDPRLCIDPDGYPVVAWSGYIAPERVILVSRWTGSGWQPVGPALSAAAGANTPGIAPSLAIDSTGQMLVGWHESDGATFNIHVYRYNN